LFFERTFLEATMSNLFKSIVAGFIATAVMSAFMIIKSFLGMFPDINVISIIDSLNSSYLGTPEAPLSGWATHFFTGTIIYGVIYAYINPKLTGSNVVNGIILAVFAWLAMMVIIMPLAGFGFFGLTLGPPALVLTLVLHLIYGITLGYSYGRLSSS
jgi:Family of unknown function (DUF6789)